MLDDVVGEPVGEDLAGQRWYRHTGGLSFEDVAKILEIAVAASHDRVSELEGRDVGARMNFVRSVHVSLRGAMSLWILDLERPRWY